MSKRFPGSIPPAVAELESLRRSVEALKNILELMTGDRDKNSLGVPRVYLQRTTPIGGTQGDFWVNTDTKALSYFSLQGTWETIA